MAQNDGYTAPFILQDILTQKRAAQHQKLIDSLDLVQQQANMENAAKQREQQAQDARDTAAYRTGQLQESAADRESRERIAGMKEPTPPGIVSEYKFAVENGYKGSFNQYQTEDANRKRVNPPAGPNYSYSGVDPKTGRPFTINNKTGQSFTMDDTGKPVLYLGPAGAKPSAASDNGGPSPAEFIKLADLAGKAAPGKPSMFGLKAGTADPKAVAAYNQAVNNIVARYNVAPEIIHGVLAALNEDPNIPTEQIIASQKASGATPDELAAFSKLLTIARGR